MLCAACFPCAAGASRLCIRSDASCPAGLTVNRLHADECPCSPGHDDGFDLPCQLAQLARRMGTSSQAVDPTELFDTFCRRCPGLGFEMVQQQDAHEALMCLLRAIKDIYFAAGLQDKVNFFLHIEETSRTCLHCKNHFVRHNETADGKLDYEICVLSLPPKDVTEALETDEEEEVVDDFMCDNCGRRGEAKVRHSYSVLGKVVVLHLKRAFCDRRGNNRKLRDHVPFPATLPLSSVTCDNAPGTLCLKAVVQHIGATVHSGHYVAHVQHASGQWYTKNDEVSSKISLHDVQRKEAYMLFYELSEVGSTEDR